ncbi:MAG TPA: PQQ-dependent sugar dehydrogenase [Nitrososphaeraceae archaeon]|nr:PQQ-dependent sugar dehydrogenase [Nitrososphaeraceae archaeon]
MTKPQIQSLLALALSVTISIGTIHPFNPVLAQPMVVKDPNLKVELFAQGLKSPTSMAFLGPNDILVLEKDTGTVQRIVNGKMLPQPILQVPVSTTSERGMLGIAIAKHTNGPTYVFLYYTKLGAGTQSLANVLYRYELVNNQQLSNPKLLLNLPAIPGANHNGGKVVIGPDNNVYVVIGDLKAHRTQSQNVANGPPADSTGGILRVTQDGQPVPNSPLGQGTELLNLYYAYGIRNSFGIDFDPVSGKLWDTENGPKYGDEINLVEPGFNSGWVQVMGIWTPEGAIGKETAGPVNSNPSSNLVDFGGKGKYRAPEFIWFKPVAPTALKFFDSEKLGKLYQNNMFVGDIKNGNLYNFKLNQDRTGLVLNDTTLSNKISNTPQDSQPLILASGFDGGITDLQVGPEDGYLYVLTFAGSIYRITP